MEGICTKSKYSSKLEPKSKNAKILCFFSKGTLRGKNLKMCGHLPNQNLGGGNRGGGVGNQTPIIELSELSAKTKGVNMITYLE